MAAVKWLIVTVCSISALGLTGLGVKQSLVLSHEAPAALMVAKLSLRPWPKPFVPGPRGPAAGAPAAAHAAAVDAGTPAALAVVARSAVDAGMAGVVVRPVVSAPAPVAAPGPAAAAALTEGLLFLRSSDTADVFVDGKRVGSAPVLSLKVKAGAHKVRFDCYDEAGNTVAGAVQTVTASTDKPVDITFQCPPSE